MKELIKKCDLIIEKNNDIIARSKRRLKKSDQILRVVETNLKGGFRNDS